MKIKITLIALLMTLIVSANLFASGNYLDQIKKNLKSYPEVAADSNLEGFVLVTVKVNQDGKAEILAMNSSHQTFADHVRSKLKQIDLGQQHCLSGTSFSYRINYSQPK